MIRWLLWTLLLTGLALPAAAIDLKRLQQVQKLQQQSLIAEAREAAKDWEFDAAEGYLRQAENQAYNPQEIASAESYITEQRAAKKAHDRRVREEQERKRREAERQRQARLAAQSGSGGGGGTVSHVSVQFDPLCIICTAEDLKVWGGPGSFSASYGGAATGAIYPRGVGLAGRYNWSGRSSQGWGCSGTINISGRHRNVVIRVDNNCRDAGTQEY